MILTGNEIEREWSAGRITIDPFVREQVNPNSYNFRLGKTLRVYSAEVLDARTANDYEEITIPPEGLILEPQQLYLAHTIELLGSDHYAPTFAARSSIARLGIFINLSASLGDIGYKGQWTLQLYTMNRVRVYAGISIGQMMWWRPTGRIELYEGKYQGASGPRSSDIHLDFHRQFARQRLPSLYAGVSADEVGPKFAALARSVRDFPVPPAFCVPAPDFAAAIGPELETRLASAFVDLQATVGAFFTESVAEIAQLAEKIAVPAELRELIEVRFADLFPAAEGRQFAVRSSGLDEDTESSSMAGIHDSVLGVPGPPEVILAIEQCWRSWYSAPAVAARVRAGQFGWRPRLAVIVQQQIHPIIAGVAFSEPAPEPVPKPLPEPLPAPAGGEQPMVPEPAAVVIEYVEGLADRLVAGVDVPTRVTSGELADEPPGPAGHRPAGLGDVVTLTRRLREVRGEEVDVEWALAADGLYLIQVRPNTAAPTGPESADEPVTEVTSLYDADLPAGFTLADVADVYGTYTLKRGPAYRLAAQFGVATGRGWVVRLNQRGLHDPDCRQRLSDALAEGYSTEGVLDAGGSLRQMVLPKTGLADRLGELFGTGAEGRRLHTVIVRDFVRGQLGVITRLTERGLVLEYSPQGLMSLNRGTAGATTVTVADRRRGTDEPGNVSVSAGGGDSGDLLGHLDELSRFTEAMSDRYGDCTLEWVLAGGLLYFVDYSLLNGDSLVVSATGTVVVSAGNARGPLLRLTDDDLLARLSTGPAVSIDKAADLSQHEGLAKIVDRVTSAPERPIVHTSRPYAVLSVLIGHVAGFVFDQDSVLGHLPILLREARVPAVSAPDFTGEGEILISDGIITFATEKGHP